jgi:hypothetical protein
MIGIPRQLRRFLAVGCGVAVLVAATACTALNPNASASPSASATASPADTPSASANPSPTTVSQLGPLTGAWKGTWTNREPQIAIGTFVLTWAQQGDLLFGAIGVTGSNCIKAGNVTGNVAGSRISFGAVEGGTSIQYDGTIDGNTMSGTYHSDCGNSTGTWTATKS